MSTMQAIMLEKLRTKSSSPPPFKKSWRPRLRLLRTSSFSIPSPKDRQKICSVMWENILNRRENMRRGSAVNILGLSLGVFLFLTQFAVGGEKGSLIKLGTLAPEGSSWMKTFNAINTEVMRKTGNTVRFRIYPGGILGDEMDMLRKLKIGQIQGVALTSAGLSTLFNEIDVLQVPFLFQTYEEVDTVLKKMDSFFR